MNKKTLKVLTFVAIIIAIVFSFSFAFALESPDKITISDPKDKGVENVGGQILGIIRVVGMILSVGILMVLGIKYMMGSASEKAEYKKTMIPYVVGAVVLFAASAIAGAIFNMAKDLKL